MSDNIQGVSAQQLKMFIEKLERLEEEKTEIAENIRDTFAQAKSEGFDVKTMRQLLKIRKMKREDVVEQEELLDIYRQALGMTFEMERNVS